MTGTWEVHIDPDRTIKLDLNGSFDVTEDKTEADAGETEIMVETFGVITATNISDGRDVEGIKTGLQLFVPIEFCPDWESLEPKGTHCSRDLITFKIPDLDVGESKKIDISDSGRVAHVPVEHGATVVASMLGDDGAVVSADRWFWNEYLGELNESCEFVTSDAGIGSWVTYFTEDPAVTACSTEELPS